MARRLSRNARGAGNYTVVRGDHCVYCGDRGDTSDHFTPLSVAKQMQDVGIVVTGKVKLPSCRECNALAGAKLFDTIAGKKRWIRSELRRRHAKLLAFKDWSEDELDDLGPDLRTTIESSMAAKSRLMARLAW